MGDITSYDLRGWYTRVCVSMCVSNFSHWKQWYPHAWEQSDVVSWWEEKKIKQKDGKSFLFIAAWKPPCKDFLKKLAKLCWSGGIHRVTPRMLPIGLVRVYWHLVKWVLGVVSRCHDVIHSYVFDFCQLIQVVYLQISQRMLLLPLSIERYFQSYHAQKRHTKITTLNADLEFSTCYMNIRSNYVEVEQHQPNLLFLSKNELNQSILFQDFIDAGYSPLITKEES